MTSTSLKKEIVKKLDILSIEDQRKILDFTLTLSDDKIKGIPGRELILFAGKIEKTELDSIKKAIESGCERIDSNEW